MRTPAKHRARSLPVVRSPEALTAIERKVALDLGQLDFYRGALLRIEKLRDLPPERVADAKQLIVDVERKIVDVIKEATWLR